MNSTIENRLKPGIIIKLLLLLSVFVAVFVVADDEAKTDVSIEKTDKASQIDQKASIDVTKPKSEIKPADEIKQVTASVKKEAKAPAKKKEKFVPIRKTIFVNSRVNPIVIVLTDHKSESTLISIPMGQKYEYINYLLPEHLLKVVCHDPHSSKTLLSKADLETYAVFVFNESQVTDKFHFINFVDHIQAKKRARDLGLIDLWDEINQQTIYNL